MNKEAYIAYLQSRKASNKTNYYLYSLQEIDRIRKDFDHKPKILLHACCGPCAGWPLEFLHDIFDITIIFNNSNIYPEKEYTRRLEELKKLLTLKGYDDIQLIVTPYDNVSYTKELEPMKDDPEGWERCFFCYRKRMEEAYRYAVENHFDYFTTVMTISRQKDSRKLNEIGLDLQKKYPSVRYFCSDFKKKGGQVRRDEIVRELDLYNQDYCGCIYSYMQRKKEN